MTAGLGLAGGLALVLACLGVGRARRGAHDGRIGVEILGVLAGLCTATLAGMLGAWPAAATLAAASTGLAMVTARAATRAWRARHPHNDRPARSRASTRIGVLLLAVAVVLTGWVTWSVTGTTTAAQHTMHEQVVAFYDHAGSPGPGVATLRTDFVADPPPTPAMTATGTWATLIVPSWAGEQGAYGEDLSTRIAIASGTSTAVLNKGWAGHFDASAAPGQVGNMALAGHRRTYGQNFNRVGELHPGDALVIETANTWYVYTVTGQPETVAPTAVEEVAPVPHHPEQPPLERLATLTTCTSTTVGQWGNDHRLAVHATLLGWAPRSEGIPPQLASTSQ